MMKIGEEFNFNTLLERMRHYAGVYEYHITTDLPQTELSSLEQWSVENGCKVTTIELISGNTPFQPMLTGVYLKHSPEDAWGHLTGLCTKLSSQFDITRIKVETSIGNKNVPVSKEVALTEPEDCYFEHHVKVSFDNSYSLQELRKGAWEFGAHLSRNPKKQDTIKQTRFLTQRCHKVDNMTAKQSLQTLLQFLETTPVQVLSKVREYNIFDSNTAIDKGWMS